MMAIQPGELNESYLVSADFEKAPLPDCAVPEDEETPILSRNGMAVIMTNCWSSESKNEGDYQALAIEGRTLKIIPGYMGKAAWIGNSERIVAEGRNGLLYLINTSSPSEKQVLVDFGQDIHHIVVNSSGNDALVVSGGDPVTVDEQIELAHTTVSIVSLSTGKIRAFKAPPNTTKAVWADDERLVIAETHYEWFTLAAGTGATLSRRPRPTTTHIDADGRAVALPCTIEAMVRKSPVAWCRATGEIFRYPATGPHALVTKVPQATAYAGEVSLAVDRILR
jgi:hypothetical protein